MTIPGRQNQIWLPVSAPGAAFYNITQFRDPEQYINC